MQELDSTFQSLILVGYHSRMGSGGNPLSHTMSGNVTWLKINDSYASEFTLCAYTAALVKVPLTFVSGDKELCDDVVHFNPRITTVAVKEGVGDSTINIHPDLAVERIRSEVSKAVSSAQECLVSLPGHFTTEVRFRRPERAYLYGFFPGARLVDATTVQFEHDNFFEVMRFLLFAL
jgi:D-amino peptidase